MAARRATSLLGGGRGSRRTSCEAKRRRSVGGLWLFLLGVPLAVAGVLFMPPVPSLIISSLIFLLMRLSIGTNVFMFFPGFILGYLLYGSMHYAIHAWNPPFKWMKPLWRNHHLHHYKNEHQGYGVSSTIWDRVFGTMFDLKKEKEDKEKVKELMF